MDNDSTFNFINIYKLSNLLIHASASPTSTLLALPSTIAVRNLKIIIIFQKLVRVKLMFEVPGESFTVSLDDFLYQ